MRISRRDTKISLKNFKKQNKDNNHQIRNQFSNNLNQTSHITWNCDSDGQSVNRVRKRKIFELKPQICRIPTFSKISQLPENSANYTLEQAEIKQRESKQFDNGQKQKIYQSLPQKREKRKKNFQSIKKIQQKLTKHEEQIKKLKDSIISHQPKFVLSPYSVLENYSPNSPPKSRFLSPKQRIKAPQNRLKSQQAQIFLSNSHLSQKKKNPISLQYNKFAFTPNKQRTIAINYDDFNKHRQEFQRLEEEKTRKLNELTEYNYKLEKQILRKQKQNYANDFLGYETNLPSLIPPFNGSISALDQKQTNEFSLQDNNTIQELLSPLALQ